MLYGECSLNPLTPDEQTLVNELMKGGFKIPSAKEIKARKKATIEKKKRKAYDMTAVDQVTIGGSTPSGSTEPSP